MSQDGELQREIDAIRADLERLSAQLSALERRLQTPGRAALPSGQVAAAPAVRAAPPQPPSGHPGPSSLPPPARPRREALEVTIGRDWLNKLGVASLVFGVAFFILYAFQYLGPAPRMAIGYAVSAALIFLGLRLEPREPLRWYGRGLIGGGWALAYFTTYAMHHIQAVRLIDSALLDVLLLAAVAAGAIRHSLRFKSQSITALALLLGFITTSLSDITYFTLISSALLVAALAGIVVRMRWDGVLLYGVIASYAAHLVWISRQIAMSPRVAVYAPTVSVAEFWLTTGFVATYWVLYHAAAFAFDEQTVQRRNRIMTATLLNGLLFTYAILVAMERVYPGQQYLVVFGVGLAYWCSGPVSQARRLGALADVQTLLGLVLMTVALPLKLTGQWLSFLWALEVPLLVWAGLRYQRGSYRLVAAGLAAVVFLRLIAHDLVTDAVITAFGRAVAWRLLMGPVGIAALGLSAWWYRSCRGRPILKMIEDLAYPAYLFAASAGVWLLTEQLAPPAWLAALLALEGAASVWLGFRLNDILLRAGGSVACSLAGLRLLATLDVWNTWSTVVTIGVLFALSGRYRAEAKRQKASSVGFTWYVVGSSLLLTLLLYQEVTAGWITLVWAAESLVLLGAGLRLREPVLRTFSLGVSALLLLLLLVGLIPHWMFGAANPSAYWSLARTPGVVLALFLASWLYRARPDAELSFDERMWSRLYAAAGSVVLTLLLWKEVPSRWLSVAWALEGVGLVAAGFGLTDKVLRVSGLAVFGLLVLKILFVDLAGTDTIYRILSFIVAGLMLLAASFAYARFTSRTRDDASKP